MNELFLIVNSVEGLASGAYRYDREQHELELLEEGDFRGEAGHLGLDQQIPADASVDVYMLADLKPVLDAFGNRGYRMAQLESGIIGGRLYLMAYGMGFGASGLTLLRRRGYQVLWAGGRGDERDVSCGLGPVGKAEKG